MTKAPNADELAATIDRLENACASPNRDTADALVNDLPPFLADVRALQAYVVRLEGAARSYMEATMLYGEENTQLRGMLGDPSRGTS